MKVLISGAGVGGLAAARALLADGHQVTVFEQATEQRQGGAAVTLWSNGTGVLSELGIDLAGVGAPIDVLETRDHRGRLLLSIDVARSAAHYGRPHVCLPRTRLTGLLAEGLPPGTVTFGRPVKSASTTTAAPVRLRQHFGDWAPPVTDVLAAITDEETGGRLGPRGGAESGARESDGTRPPRLRARPLPQGVSGIEAGRQRGLQPLRRADLAPSPRPAGHPLLHDLAPPGQQLPGPRKPNLKSTPSDRTTAADSTSPRLSGPAYELSS